MGIPKNCLEGGQGLLDYIKTQLLNLLQRLDLVHTMINSVQFKGILGNLVIFYRLLELVAWMGCF